VLQKIPESEPDGPVSVAAGDGLHHHPHHGSVDQASLPHHGHPPLKPSLSLSLDPCSNLFRFKETRRYHQKCLSIFKSSHQLIIKKLSLPPKRKVWQHLWQSRAGYSIDRSTAAGFGFLQPCADCPQSRITNWRRSAGGRRSAHHDR
jgi:hypothetical protein